MLEKEHPYEFESTGSLRRELEAEIYLRALEARLGFSENCPAVIFKNRLRDFVINCHLSIAWYKAKIEKELRLRFWYFAISLGLLAVLPVALWLTAKYFPGGTNTTTQMGAILAGLLAFYRGISAWLDKRQVVAGYSKAMSDLKDLLYSFEQKWDGAATNPERESEFTHAIKEATSQSRSIVRVETQQYFNTLAYPTLDLGEVLNASGQQARNLIAQIGRTMRPAVAEAGGRDAHVAQLRALVDGYNAQLLELGQGGNVDGVTELRRLRDQAVDQLRIAQIASAAT